MNTRRQPEQQPPPVQRLRLRYAKRGRARFSSHRDFARAFERALRRAGVPMAYSSGFSPHPRISYANAAPTGAASEAEYVEIGLAREVDPARLREAVSAALPLGLDVDAVVVASGGSLADRLSASSWRLEVVGVAEDIVRDAVAALWASGTAMVSRMTRAGVREFDARPAILRLEVTGPATVVFVGRQDAPLVRPDDVVAALAAVEPRFVPSVPVLATRLAQGTWTGDGLRDPFEE